MMLLWCVSNNHASSSTNIYYVKHHRNCRTCAFKCPEPDVFFCVLFYKNSSWLKLLPLVINIGHYYFIGLVVVVVNAIQFNLFCVDPVFSLLYLTLQRVLMHYWLEMGQQTSIILISVSSIVIVIQTSILLHFNLWRALFEVVHTPKKSGETINKLMALNESSLISNQWV